MPKRATKLRISANRDELEVAWDPHEFWSEDIIDPRTGTTQLDQNIAAVCQEVRTALYFIAASDLTKH